MAARGNTRTTRPAAQAKATTEEATTPEATPEEVTTEVTPEEATPEEATPEEVTPEEATGTAGAPAEQDETGDTQEDTDPATTDTPEEEPEPEPTWTDVVPLIALMIGAAPSPEEKEAARLLWVMLADTPEGVTAGGVVRRAEDDDWPEIETTTVKAVMGRFQSVGIVACGETDKGRQRWTLGKPSDVVAAVTAVGARPRSARASALAIPTTTRAAGGREGHWAPGELKAAVAAFVHGHPQNAHKAQAVCDGIGTHQHGSVRAALDSLTKAGEITQVTDSPRSWQSTPAA